MHVVCVAGYFPSAKFVLNFIGATTTGDIVTKYWTKLAQALSLAILSIAFLVSFSVFVQAAPNCTGACVTGAKACADWCYAHNKTVNSQVKCQIKCDDYWYSGKNPQNQSQ